MARFNPPPSWPTPPPGWSPPQGWTPPASWPAPPEGWSLWVPDDAPAPVAGATAVRPAQPRRRGRRLLAGVAAGAGLFVLGVGALGAAGAASDRASTHDSAAVVDLQSVPSATAPSPSLSPVAPSPSTTASSAPALVAAATPAVTPSPVPSPVLSMSCGGSGASAVFSHDVDAATPYSVAIDYGDGRSYTGDDAHLAAVFSHTYRQGGSYTVTARLTDGSGQTATSSCTYSWTAPVVPSRSSTTSGSSGSGSGTTSGTTSGSSSGAVGSGDDYYTNSDGNSVHRPEYASSAPAGATAQCGDGTYSFSQHRSGTCSHHGGVADWL